MDQLEKIQQLKKKRNAIILAHNYQRADVAGCRWLVGGFFWPITESGSKRAAVIVFCGVDFMAESAAVLNPDKIVLMPNFRRSANGLPW